uniref:SMAP domain-containing protein n=1 Tax=Haemonchus placei TaxID=6290 RepID=A0A0N4X084_HAEPC
LNEKNFFRRPRRDDHESGRSDRDSHRGGRSGWNRDDNRRRDDRRKDRHTTWDIRPSAEEVAKQRKLLWSKAGSNKEVTGEGSGAAAASTAPSQDKNVGLWSSAITASGVAGDQANKFLKLMGIKNVPAEDSNRLKEESEKQKKMMRDLDRQYEIAREATHMGRGLGLGFHQ